MRRKGIRRLAALCVLVVAGTATVVVLLPGTATSVRQEPANNVLARQLAIERGDVKASKAERAVSGSVMTAVQSLASEPEAPKAPQVPSQAIAVPPSHVGNTNGCPNRFAAGAHGVDNIRVNQDCTLRRQAEEWVGVNPLDSSNVLAGQNDNVIGFNHCGYDWSLNGGQSWGSVGTQAPPFCQEILDDGHTADACSAPAGTFDHLGNAYVTGIFFDIQSPASALFVARSNYPIKGRFYHSPFEFAPPATEEYRTTPMGRVASANDPNIFHDKELMVGDTRPDSAKKGRVYVTWTRFETNNTPVGGRSPIVFSQSVDGGATWSQAVIISGSSSAFCTAFSGTPGNPNACDQDQGSHPVVGPDGTIYVIFGNGNTPDPGINQVLMVRCRPSVSCTSAAHWEGPFRVGGLIGTHPFGPSPNGCPPGRQCLPPNGYRVPEFTSMSVSVDRNNNVYAIWADHRNNTNPSCNASAPGGGAPPCDHDVFFAHSANQGTTWSPTVNVTPRASLGETAQWQPWSDVLGDGSALQVAFYDRQYGNCESTGCNDITLATIANPMSAGRTITYRRITTGSMPNLTPANNPVQAGFLGDYMWLEVSRHNFDQRRAHIVWADTRQLFGPNPEEDVYYASVDAPTVHGGGGGGHGSSGSPGGHGGDSSPGHGGR